MDTTTTIVETEVQADDDKTRYIGKEEQKTRFIQLRAKGYSLTKIAKELHVSKGTLSSWNQDLERQIARARAMELEALQEEYYLLKEGRIKLLGEQLKAIQKEISNRDFSKVSTDRLMDLQLRYFVELKGEYVEIRQEDKTGTKLNSEDIIARLQSILERLEAGQISESQAKQEQMILQSILKAIEQMEIQGRLERLEALLKTRRQEYGTREDRKDYQKPFGRPLNRL
jgi:transposase